MARGRGTGEGSGVGFQGRHGGRAKGPLEILWGGRRMAEHPVPRGRPTVTVTGHSKFIKIAVRCERWGEWRGSGEWRGTSPSAADQDVDGVARPGALARVRQLKQRLARLSTGQGDSAPERRDSVALHLRVAEERLLRLRLASEGNQSKLQVRIPPPPLEEEEEAQVAGQEGRVIARVSVGQRSGRHVGKHVQRAGHAGQDEGRHRGHVGGHRRHSM